ncbi:bifunctional 4-hydroxy-2-oxoglutarate aldolase/2-dehydro-3-deoxy-phosphogluconate aldolase [Alpinimonas psychrophila]|uniref:2-dehydro-3-deoxyphosphogluconate aldolase/(4S)-4-hydroxy-2-oxoglutarate aldolase n=1 Tax=Alpinimonas psychrophila TaxID=748908 RepID=A0A7W3JTM2_9MICO|nr:bifunctional 4-hydroxy-2-oxoglutarate aldolase/2-dehydro-3-deoxy-phosphogluconate aldolase [Alpinimonas psychrophila]MBA8829026.1 2-dehydro-3-deoxyphosphogluconate aldolase/(4S)-4-hydroxy-2-oxoglutarate aldolase [Alpinimonas psychrophila]
MESTEFFSKHFEERPIMAIFRGQSPARTVELCRTVWALGIDLVEIPVQSEVAIPSLRAAIAEARSSGRIVGAGTVTTLEQLREVKQLGAMFTVAPGFADDVARESARLDIPHLPGVATATEISHAVRGGFRWLKAFPAAQLGTGWVRAQHGPFPSVKFVATGGIDADNAADFLASGCGAVSIGSAFTSGSDLAFLDNLK